MSRSYKNIIKLRRTSYGKERRENLVKEVLKDATPLPSPLEYEDIDKEFNRWVSEDLSISFEEQKLPTYLMLSNQRFSEYLQSWQNVDNNKNLILNFKTITRENNPKPGTIVGGTRNIPGNIDFLMKRVFSVDRHGNRYFTDYRVKQPISVDLNYVVSIFTNKYQLLNEFNLMVNDKFKSIDCYIRPNGHFIPMKLNDISDESEYNIDDRRFFSQSYLITVMAYIIPKDSFRVVEQPMLKLDVFDGEVKSRTIVEEIECDESDYNPYEYSEIQVTSTIEKEDKTHKFRIDCDSQINSIQLTNVKYFKLYINGKFISLDNFFNDVDKTCYQDIEIKLDEIFDDDELKQFILNENDMVQYTSITRYKTFEPSKIKLIGKDFSNVVEK